MSILPNIALTGRIRSGKDTVAAHLVERYGYARFAFADGLRDICSRLYPDQFTDAAGNDVTPRALLQGVGQALRQFDPNVWVRQCFSEIYAKKRDNDARRFPSPFRAVITDLRQPNEYDRCRAEGFVIIRVKAPSTLRIHRAATGGDTFKLADLTHETETHVDGFAVDYEITNDGTLDELYAQIDTLMRSQKLT